MAVRQFSSGWRVLARPPSKEESLQLSCAAALFDLLEFEQGGLHQIRPGRS